MKTVISTPNAPGAIGPYSQGYAFGDLVITSGQIPVDPATGAIPEGIAAQAEQSCKNVGAILEAAGVHMGGDVPGADVHPVLVQLPRLDDPQRGHGDIVSLQQLPRQVAGGVGGDLNHTDSSFWSHPRTAVRG